MKLIHSPTVLVTLGVVLGVALLSSQQYTEARPQERGRRSAASLGADEFVDALAFVLVEEGQPFNVPAGSEFVPLGVSVANRGASAPAVDVCIDGMGVARVEFGRAKSGGPDLVTLGPGLSAPAGAAIEPRSPYGATGVLIGYLVEGRPKMAGAGTNRN